MLQMLDLCLRYVEAGLPSLDEASLTIRGLWKIQYALRLTPSDFPVPREFLLIQTTGFGSCHYEVTPPAFHLDCVGRSATEVLGLGLPYKIAALDAIASELVGPPAYECLLDGTNCDKAGRRAEIIVRETARLAAKVVNKRKARVVLVGALGSLLVRLKSLGCLEVAATDHNPRVGGRTYHGVQIEGASATIEKISASDVAIVTGMALANGTVDGILETAALAGVRVLMYLQTGANLVQPYLDSGVSTIVSEPYPFYLMGPGSNMIRVYRASSRP
jgi:Putative heavy-metal chelation